MARHHTIWSMLGVFVASSALGLGCAEDQESGPGCMKDDCLAASCDFVCVKVYDGCDYAFKTTAGRVATFEDCVVACDKGFFTANEVGCLAQDDCEPLDRCFEDEVPALPAELIAIGDDRPEAGPPGEFYPTPGGDGDDGEAYPQEVFGGGDGSSRMLPVEERRPEANPPGKFYPTPGEPTGDRVAEPRDSYAGDY